jgi:hypothetical protein
MASPARSWSVLSATARNLSVGAPRLYRAARQSGASTGQALDVLVVSASVLAVAAQRGAGERGRQNAVRHFAWQAVLTGRHGVHVARAVADAQERGSTRLRDSAVDQRNNAAGQAWGHAHEHELKDRSSRSAIDVAFAAALSKWADGELAR